MLFKSPLIKSLDYWKTMETLSEIWPFAVGHQKLIFNFLGAAVIGLILLNIFSALRQHLPIQKLLSGLFVEIGAQNGIEKNLRILLILLLVTGFIALIIDTQVNGMQLVNLQSIQK